MGEAVSILNSVNADHEHDDASEAGTHMVVQEGKDKRGAAVSSGICFMRSTREAYHAVRRPMKFRETCMLSQVPRGPHWRRESKRLPPPYLVTAEIFMKIDLTRIQCKIIIWHFTYGTLL